jgi:predicted dinucleotide-binding enzyme
VNITVIGRGNVGGGLARRWENAGHAVTAIGREGGDASDADAVLVAVSCDQPGMGPFFYRYARRGEL